MSYDLYFWRQTSACDLTPQQVVESVYEAGAAPGVLDFPLGDFLDRFEAEFPDAVRERRPSSDFSDLRVWKEPDESGLFMVFWEPSKSPRILGIESRRAYAESLNRVIELVLEFDAPLYDPQTEKRYA